MTQLHPDRLNPDHSILGTHADLKGTDPRQLRDNAERIRLIRQELRSGEKTITSQHEKNPEQLVLPLGEIAVNHTKDS